MSEANTTLRRALLLACLPLAIGLIELLSIVSRGSATQHPAAAFWYSSLLAHLMVCGLAALWFVRSRGPLQFVRSLAATVAVTVFLCVILFFWMTSWISGYVLSTDALRLLVDNLGQAALHLLQTDRLVLLLMLLALGAVCLGCHALARWIGVRERSPPTRSELLWGSLLAASTVLHVTTVGSADVPPLGSYSALLGGGQSERDAPTATCPGLSALPATSGYASAAAGSGRPVIVILVESLRWDLLEKYPAATPNLRRIATESLLFDKAYATSSHSDYSDLSIWYSRYPLRSVHRTTYPANAPSRGVSAFEYFKAAGYHTAYFSSQNENWADMINWLDLPEVDRFFHSEDYEGETWENDDDDRGLVALIRAGAARAGKVEDTETLRLATEWLRERQDEAFFMGLNLQNTHYSYVIPDGGEEPFQPARMGFKKVYAAWPVEMADNVRNRYLNAVYNVDKAIGAFVEKLKELGIWERAIVVIAGDNGEGFYEHGYANHSGPMYDEGARTLVMAKLPGGPSGVYEKPISHLDLLPLVIDAAQLSPWRGFQGISPLQHQEPYPVFMTVNAIVREHGVVSWPWKLLSRSFPASVVELYNLENDPGETQNVAATHPAVALSLLQAIENWEACQIGYYQRRVYERSHPPLYPGLTHASVERGGLKH